MNAQVIPAGMVAHVQMTRIVSRVRVRTDGRAYIVKQVKCFLFIEYHKYFNLNFK
jgi:hypothetical protein